MEFAVMGQGVTRATAPEASRLCETFSHYVHEIRRQTQSDPAGGHPGRVVEGHLEVQNWEA